MATTTQTVAAPAWQQQFEQQLGNALGSLTIEIEAMDRDIELGAPGHHFLARINSGPPPGDNPYPTFTPRRVAVGIGEHRITDFFDISQGGQPSMRDAILSIIRNDDYTFFGVVRLGFEHQPHLERPVTVLIAVRPSTTTVSRAGQIVTDVGRYVHRLVFFSF